MFHSTPIRALLLSTICFLLAASAFAQYGASLQGTVTDKSGAVVGRAKVTIINTGQFGHAPDGLAGRVIEFQARLSF